MDLVEGDLAHAVESYCGIFVLSHSETGRAQDAAVLDVEWAFFGGHDFRVISCFPKQGGAEVVKLCRGPLHSSKLAYTWQVVER
jgi:thiamine monophosphate kinase